MFGKALNTFLFDSVKILCKLTITLPFLSFTRLFESKGILFLYIHSVLVKDWSFFSSGYWVIFCIFTVHNLCQKKLMGLLLKPRPRPWTRTLDLDPEKPGPRKAWTLKILDHEKPGPWKTWETAGMQKKIRRPHSIILLTLEIF